MGAADIVPGVSGGTIALITGIYERLLGRLWRWTVRRSPWRWRVAGVPCGIESMADSCRSCCWVF